MQLSWTSRDKARRVALDRAMAAISRDEDTAGAIFDCIMEIVTPPMPREHMPALFVSLSEQCMTIRRAVGDDEEHLVYLEALLLAHGINPYETAINVALTTEFILGTKGAVTYGALLKRIEQARINKARGDGAMDSEEFLLNMPDFLADSLSPEAREKRDMLLREADNG